MDVATMGETGSIVDLFKWKMVSGMVVDRVDDGANGVCSVTVIA